MEFHADLVLPYRNDFQSKPMHGQFLLVQLETPDEAVLGRIASFSSEGKLATGTGEEFNIRAVREGRDVPEDLRTDYLRYRVNIRVLGVLRRRGAELTFVASHRRLPHVGSPVAFPSADVLRSIVGHDASGAPIGHYALGEYIYSGSNDDFDRQDWMQVQSPEVLTRFPVEALVSRRSFIFARAGFGKSNLTKLLFASLYTETPTVIKRGGREVPVGTIIFDPEGEYFWPDASGRPGLADVPELEDKLVVFTSRRGPSSFYDSFVAGGVKLDIRRLKPADVIAIALPPERQEQQNVTKLRGLSQDRWERLVNLIEQNGHATEISDMAELLNLDFERQQAEAIAARSNMATIVAMLHDKSSLLMDRLLSALSAGKLCVVDVSQMRGGQAMILSGLILRRIFERNQNEFTKAEPQTIPTIAVVEEAQTVLSERASAAEPYIAWVKEGRKYDLGALMITQQPGSIPHEILSQGDNWFIFHLLSAGDLINVKRANAHFSDDLLSGILNEPIPGQGVFWSSAAEKPYPIALRALSFERMFDVRDPDYHEAAAETYAATLKRRFDAVAGEVALAAAAATVGDGDGTSPVTVEATSDGELILVDESPEEPVDVFGTVEARAIAALDADEELKDRIRDEGVPWGGLNAFFEQNLPELLENRADVAFHLVPKALDRVFGDQVSGGWHTFKHPTTNKTWVKAGAV
jgi:DNA helicase HerA-like ATPase